MANSPEENIVQSTVFVEAISKSMTSFGTGFRFFIEKGKNSGIPLLFTNKHVTNDADSLRIHFSLSDPADYTKKVGVASCHIEGDWRSMWIPHPDAGVDLGALALAPILNEQEKLVRPSYGIAFTEYDLIDAKSLAALTPIEDVLMVGYPIGLRDPINNQPIVRRGTTATDPKVRFQGREEFLIDCACWPGSSGSPVLIKTQALKFEGNQIFARQSQIFLAGVLYAGPTHNAQGEITFEPIPTSAAPIVNTPQMIHLGNVINAQRIRELVIATKALTNRSFPVRLNFEFIEF